MAAHRYWRLFVSIRGGSNTVRINEVSMRTSVGGSNVATGGSPFGDGSTDPPANAFDGNTTNYWAVTSSSNANAVLGYDFGAGNEKDIVEIALDCNSSIGTTGVIPGQSRLEYSDDNVTWIAVSPGYLPTASFGTQTFGPFVASQAPRANNSTARLNPGWPNPSGLTTRYSFNVSRNRTQDSGLYRIGGTVKVDGSPDTPVARKVVLFDQVSLRPLQDTFSDETTGEYEFTHLANKPHMVMSFDHTNNFRAVVADRITPEPMP